MSDDYYCVADAGSSSTKLFHVQQGTKSKKPVILGKLADLAVADSDSATVNNFRNEMKCPKHNATNTNIFILATQGMRALDPSDQAQIYGNICDYYKPHGHTDYMATKIAKVFSGDIFCETLTGEDEAEWEYAALGDQTSLLNQELSAQSVLVISVGGQSTQMAHVPGAPDNTVTPNTQNTPETFTGTGQGGHDLYKSFPTGTTTVKTWSIDNGCGHSQKDAAKARARPNVLSHTFADCVKLFDINLGPYLTEMEIALTHRTWDVVFFSTPPSWALFDVLMLEKGQVDALAEENASATTDTLKKQLTDIDPSVDPPILVGGTDGHASSNTHTLKEQLASIGQRIEAMNTDIKNLKQTGPDEAMDAIDNSQPILEDYCQNAAKIQGIGGSSNTCMRAYFIRSLWRKLLQTINNKANQASAIVQTKLSWIDAKGKNMAETCVELKKQAARVSDIPAKSGSRNIHSNIKILPFAFCVCRGSHNLF